MKRIKQRRGITLISLIITIIILLILAGVTISMLNGKNGILNQVTKANDNSEQSILAEEVNIKIIERQMEQELGNAKSLNYYLEQISNANVEKLRKDTWYITRENAVVTVYDDGEVISGKVEIWDGTSSEVPEINDFNWYIYNAKQLKFFADYINTESDDNGNKQLTEDQKMLIKEKGYEESQLIITDDTVVYLMSNIDMGARAENESWDTEQNASLNWTPIGTFKGIFEGNDYYIRGLYVYREENFAGLFKSANIIKNLKVKDSYIETTGGCAGAIVSLTNSGEITNCHNINTSVVAGTYCAGGIVGQFSGTTIKDSTNSGNITTGSTSNGTSRIGGIVGKIVSGSEISNCTNTGAVEGKGYNVGGIAGEIGSECTNFKMENCKNTGTVLTKNSQIGGMIGTLYAGQEINNCENTGNIVATSIIAGIVGYIASNDEELIIRKCKNTGIINCTSNEITDISYAAGIVAIISRVGTIEECENYGNVNAENDYVGGIVGCSYDSVTSLSIENCKNSGQISTKCDEDENSRIGGIAGMLGSGQKINNCENLGKIVATGAYCGGIVGNIYNIDGAEGTTISYCKNTGEIIGVYYIGGIVGRTNAENSIIQKTYNTGKVEGEDSAGGIVGLARSKAKVQNCYNLAEIKGKKSVGGIIGSTGSTEENEEGSSINCYNLGKITGNNSVGGILGWTASGTIKNSYYLQGTATLDIGTGTESNCSVDANYLKTTFITNANLSETIWEIKEGKNNGYPIIVGMN